ncbi:MAG: hypothetical protein RR350_01585 [Oscillibacter sp.]
MTPEEEKSLYGPVDGTDVAADGDFSLEEILAEYGGDRQRKLLDEVEAEANPGPEPAFQPVAPTPPVAPPVARERAHRQEPAAEPAQPEEDLPPAPRPISMEQVVEHTVDAVLEEQETLVKPRRGLFSRRHFAETEELYQRPQQEPEPEPEPEPIGPEETLSEAAADWRDELHRRRAPVAAVSCIALVLTALLGVEWYGVSIPFWTGEPLYQSVTLLVLLAVTALCGRGVFVRGVQAAARKRCTSDLLASIALVVTAADCAARIFLPERSDAMPYAAVSCMAMAFAMWGGSREARGMYDTFRAAATDDDPPYLVTETESGACKQVGAVPGFYTAAMADDLPALWQTALLPVVLVASVIFAGLGSFGQQRGQDFLLNWSAILSAGATFALPLCWALPWSRLAKRLYKTGCAVGGWSGAEPISQKKCMSLTDADLFPPGTLSLNGVKMFGEELSRAVSYAASMTLASHCGLQRLFDGMLRSDGGTYETVDDFSFYEEGGVSGTIRGESVLLGTASFLRKMEVRLPGGLNLRTGIFLAVDRQLTAVFAVKYNPSENVDWALRMMKRSRITPILAARDPNITPALLKRKFNKGVKVEFPDLTTRVALSEAEMDRGLPRALLFREGLLPYAEAVVGSSRLCRAVRRSAVLALLGSISGTLLAFYLTFLGSYCLLTPLALVAFSLLWTLPVLLTADMAGRF